METMFTKKSLQDILKADSKLIVPDYQRNFVWGKDEANNMIQDIVDSDTGGNFFGTIVFQSKDRNILTVVDGQQRLTSIFILLAALRRRSQELGRSELAERIQDKIAYVDDATGKSEGSKIEVSPVISFVFEKTILSRDWKGDFTLDELKNKKREIKKIKPIYDEFWLFVGRLQNNDLEDFLRKLYNSYFGEIEIFDISTAFDIFERMNARGVELNAADLLKNHLFSELYESEVDVEKIWSDISENAPGLLRMLRYYYISRCGYVSYKKLFKKLKDYSNKIGPVTLLEDIEDFSILYSVLYDPRIDVLKEVLIDRKGLAVFSSESRIMPIMRSFSAFRLFGVTQVYPLIMSLVHSFIKDSDRDDKALKKFIRTLGNIEKFIFINHEVVGNPGNKVESDFANLAQEIYNTDPFDVDCDKINNYIKKNLESQDQFHLSFSNISYESSNLSVLYYIFDRFTNINQKGEEIIDIYNVDSRVTKNGHNIEHLRPQSEKTEENSEMIDSIGNLLLISRHTNSALGNKSFSEKMECIKQKQTKLKLVQDFLEEYGDQKEWSEDDIRDRADKLAVDAYNNIWSIK